MAAAPSEALIELRDVWREFSADGGQFAALKGIDLTIRAGEMVAIIGASGSGKSTLMNILGCLDRPTRGTYFIDGRPTDGFDADELARLRRERFGFIFQRYHLLTHLSALANVEVPAVYAGEPPAQRRDRALALLRRLGLGERTEHRPNHLSGGQQQRVSIARALMNGGSLIFADEPTGALDRRSGEEVLQILKDLHAQGSTIVIVTHDREVAEHADRIIEISDGTIVSDRATRPATTAARGTQHVSQSRMRVYPELIGDALRIALLAMRAHRLRTLLTMLGIIVGIAAVVCVTAVGEGSRRKVLADISYMGTNTIEVWAGWGWGDTSGNRRVPLQAEDAEALAREHYVRAASPKVHVEARARYRGESAYVQVLGVSEQYFDVMAIALSHGAKFTADSVKRRAQDVVIDYKTREKFFGKTGNAIGEIILLNTLPVRVVGVAADSPTLDDDNPVVLAPYTTVRSRMTGRTRIRSIVARIEDGVSTDAAEQAIKRLFSFRRGNSDIYVENSEAYRRTAESAARTLSILISSIAVIALVVGGIGVMNIMLVSVTERTSEIGVRMAVGAPRRDILAQFLIEAVLVCLCGGCMGIALALGIGPLVNLLQNEFQLIYSSTSIGAAFACSLAIGIVFGYWPASNAARLDPVQALMRG